MTKKLLRKFVLGLLLEAFILGNAQENVQEKAKANQDAAPDTAQSLGEKYLEIAEALSLKILAKPEKCTIPSLQLEALTALRKSLRYNPELKNKLLEKKSISSAMGPLLSYQVLLDRNFPNDDAKLKAKLEGTSMHTKLTGGKTKNIAFAKHGVAVESAAESTTHGSWTVKNTATIPKQHLLTISIQGKTTQYELRLITTAQGDTIFGLLEPNAPLHGAEPLFTEVAPGCGL